MRRLLLLLPLTLHAQELPDPNEAAYPAIEHFVQVLEQVRQRHPDLDKLAYKRLVNHALEGMLSSLDPHSSFIHPEMAVIMKDQPDLDTHVASLGLTFGWRDGGPYLASVMPASPAASLVAGSQVLKLDGQDVTTIAPGALLSRLQRRPGELSTLLLKSPTEPRPVEISLTHRAIASRAVTQSNLVQGSNPPAGYIRLASFSDAAPREIEASLDELEDAGMEQLILDLRANPGGSLPAAIKILGYFLPPSTAVVSIRGRNEAIQGEPLKTPERQRRKRDYPIAVVIDRMSASASELVAGTLQDLKRATILGETSYGKGSVQNIIPMGGGTALRLTIATYHTPSGRTPHLKGITPDIPIEFTDETRQKLALSFRRETLDAEESIILEGWKDPAIGAALKISK